MNDLLTELGRSVQENLDLGQDSPLAQLIRSKYCGYYLHSKVQTPNEWNSCHYLVVNSIN